MSDALIKAALGRPSRRWVCPETDIHLERPRDPAHGDWATNLALGSGGFTAGGPPGEIAEEIADSTWTWQTRVSMRFRWRVPAS